MYKNIVLTYLVIVIQEQMYVAETKETRLSTISIFIYTSSRNLSQQN